MMFPLLRFNKYKGILKISSSIDISSQDLDTFRRDAESAGLSFSEAKALYKEAGQYVKYLDHQRLTAQHSANPQLTGMMNSVRAYQSSSNGDFFLTDDTLSYAPVNSVASMFSPTAYLADLYKHAKKLNRSDLLNNLDARRPDLKDLVLNQANQDNTLSTLTLSNEVMEAMLGSSGVTNIEDAMNREMLYCQPFNRLQSVLSQKRLSSGAIFDALGQSSLNDVNVFFINKLDPGKAKSLIEHVNCTTDDDAKKLLPKYYGVKEPAALFDTKVLCKKLGISRSELEEYIDLSNYILAKYTVPFMVEASVYIQLWHLVQLHKSTALPIAILDKVLVSYTKLEDPSKTTINPLTVTAKILTLAEQQGLSYEDAAVVVGFDIDVDTEQNEVSQFTRLFNTPVLDEIAFTVNDSVTIDFTPTEIASLHIRNVLKRTFNVDDEGLFTLAMMSDADTTKDSSKTTMVCSIANISQLYRYARLSNALEVTPQELEYLQNTVSNLVIHSDLVWGEEWYVQCQLMLDTDQWVKAQGFTYSMLNAMTSHEFLIQKTDELEAFWQTLYHSVDTSELDNADTVLNDEDKVEFIVNAFAGVMMSTFGLASKEVTVSMLNWANKAFVSYSGDFTTCNTTWLMWEELIKTFNDESSCTTENEDNMVRFSHAIAQLAVIINTFAVTDTVLNTLLIHSFSNVFEYYDDACDAKVLKPSLVSLQGFSRLKDTQKSLSESQLQLYLSFFQSGDINVTNVVKLLNNDHPQRAVCAACQAIDPVENANFAVRLDRVIELLELASKHKLSISMLVDFVKNDKIFADWKLLASPFEASLLNLQRIRYNQETEENLSLGLCQYYINYVSKDCKIKDREALFLYLLIDNKVSGEVETTYIAEAIASIQLYINQCLQGFQGKLSELSNIALKEHFFTNWDKYNNRYSMWAGLQKLIFYPENYVESAERYDQTHLQQQLLADISQGEMNVDLVEQAYKSYLNNFEEVANLNVLSGYLDSSSYDAGHIYFVSKNKDKDSRYFWRCLDNSATDGCGGYIASAWGEWNEIKHPINAINNQVRPILFHSRLYVAWVEETKTFSQSDTAVKDDAKEILSYVLKFTYRKIDGSWAAAFDYPLTGLSKPFSHFYVTYCTSYDSMAVLFYNSIDDSADINNRIVYIGADMESLDDERSAHEFKTLVKGNLNDVGENKVIFSNNSKPLKCSLELKSPTTDTSGFITVTESLIDFDDVYPPGRLNYSLNINAKIPSDQFIILDLGGTLHINKIAIAQDSKHLIIDLVRNDTKEFKGSEFGYLLSYDDEPNKSGSYKVNGEVLQFTCACDSLDDLKILDLTLVQEYAPSLEEAEYIGVRVYVTAKLYIHNNWEGGFDRLPSGITTKEWCIPASEGETTYTEVVKNSYGTVIYEQDLIVKFAEEVGVKGLEKSIENAYINKDSSSGVCYLSFNSHPRRTRLNTLFTKELIKKAAVGIEQVLSYETQELAEPQLGKGFYFDLTLPAYNPVIHGSDKVFNVYYAENQLGDKGVIYTGTLSDTATSVRLFYPIGCWLNSQTSDVCVAVLYEINKNNPANLWSRFAAPAESGLYTVAEINENISLLSLVTSTVTDKMDFSGANALYFWELFYYSPMMIVDKLLESQLFEETERWLKYLYNPAGMKRQWNVRPMEEDTAWDHYPSDTTNPDIVAQADPMHYKVATKMKLIDLLLARGDAAYRQLERDTLNEAKMWYSVVSSMLGDESEMSLNNGWDNPTLGEAAVDNTVANSRVMEAFITGASKTMTTGSDTVSFYPTPNGKIAEYYGMVQQRLFNLRHNLSIDGQPLSLPIFATPKDPKALQRAAAAGSSASSNQLSGLLISIQRFAVMLESARSLVAQLTNYGQSLLSILERKDNESMSQLMQNQAVNIMALTLEQQVKTVYELQAEQNTLTTSLSRAQASLDTYQLWLDKGLSSGEKSTIKARGVASGYALVANVSRTVGAGADSFPNMFGFSNGGMHFGAMPEAIANGLDARAQAGFAHADNMELLAQYSRRTEEWESARDDAKLAVKEIQMHQASLAIRLEAAELQKVSLETEQLHLNEQLAFLETKFTSQSLYSWMHGKLATIYYQFYDLVMSRCLKAQAGYQWETEDSKVFIRPGAWNSQRAGLLCGEGLMLNLTQMESSYLDWDANALEVNRTVSLSTEMGNNLTEVGFNFNEKVKAILDDEVDNPDFSTINHNLELNDDVFRATINLADLKIDEDYPSSVVVGNTRRIKQVSVSLPALVGPYQDIQAVLSYSGTGLVAGVNIHSSCKQAAISHGINDSGKFQLNFNDSKYLPFEGLPLGGDTTSANLVLSFPNADGKQLEILNSLTDIILHIRYTIGFSKA